MDRGLRARLAMEEGISEKRAGPLTVAGVQRLTGRHRLHQLETLATVHWTVRELAGGDRDMSIDAIERALASTPEWRDKLSRANFSRDRLREAVGLLHKLRLIAAS